jgi:hypothetical protein
MDYPVTGEARQQFPVCSHALPVDGQPHPDHDETCEAAWIAPPQINQMPLHPSMPIRIVQPSPNPTTHTSVEPESPDRIPGQRPPLRGAPG